MLSGILHRAGPRHDVSVQMVVVLRHLLPTGRRRHGLRLRRCRSSGGVSASIGYEQELCVREYVQENGQGRGSRAADEPVLRVHSAPLRRTPQKGRWNRGSDSHGAGIGHHEHACFGHGLLRVHSPARTEPASPRPRGSARHRPHCGSGGPRAKGRVLGHKGPGRAPRGGSDIRLDSHPDGGIQRVG